MNTSLSLDLLGEAKDATVIAVQAGNTGMPTDMLRRLVEIGFLPGERVRIIARGLFGGAPLAVRIGTSTFALRLAEARCIQVKPVTSSEQ